MTVSLTNGVSTVTVADLLAAPLARPLRRTDVDVMNTAAYRISAGTPGKLKGTLTYLCDDLADAMALDTLYSGTAPLTLTTGGALTGLKHVAVGDLRYGTERALPGRPCKWTITVEIREVP